MKILKTCKKLEATTEKGSGKYEKQMFLKCRGILKDCKSKRNPLRMLKAYVLVMLQALNLQLCQNKKSTASIFQLICLTFICFKESFKQKSNNSEIQFSILLKVYCLLLFVFICWNLYA